MASDSEGAGLTDPEIAGLTDAELVGRLRSIEAEIERLRQVYVREHPGPASQLFLLQLRGLPTPGSEAQAQRRQELVREMDLRLGEMLRAARLALGLTLRDVGKAAGTHSRFVEEVEQARRPWSTSPGFFERACTEGRFGPADCSQSLSVWFPLADPRFCRTIREVAVDPAWLAHRDGAVATLARSIREDRSFDLLPILGDALEEAGCTDIGILAHCRRPGDHARGCWVVDVLVSAGRRG